jgi:PAS domain S-box-containing protein
MSAMNDFLSGGGEMGERIRSFDWAATALGPIAQWPQSLRSAVSILLPSKAQIAMFWGPDLVTIYNDAYRPVFGAKHPSALGRPIRDAWDELWRAGLKELFDGVLQTGEAFWAQDLPFFMERHGYLEETYFDVSYDPVRDESGRVGGVFCIVSEKTGRVLGERRLRTLRDLARVATQAHTIPDTFLQVASVLRANPQDIPFGQLYASGDADPQLMQSWGLDAEHAPQPSAGWLVHPEMTLVPAAAVLGGEFACGVWPEPLREVVVTPLAGAGDRPHGWLVCGVSARRAFDEDYRDFLAMVASGIAAALDSAHRSEDERRRAEMLAQIDRAKTAFFSNVSHEFRTPLTLLMGPVSDALADAARPLDPVHRERLEMARRSALRLEKLVNSLLDFARIEAGRANATYVATDLASFTAELASSFRSAMEKAGLGFEVDCPPSREPAYVDRDMWEKLVLNLLSNAFKFTFEGEVLVSLHEVGDGFQLRVRDTGVGIPREALPRMFERFYRVESTRSRTHEGSGIGLALVQELARLHGGRVTVESVQGKGTCFTVTIPAGMAHLDPDRVGQVSGQASTAVRARAFADEAARWLPVHEVRNPQRGAAQGRIVLADDNADMRQYLGNLLSPTYDVELVDDGQAALDAVRARGADLVISDVMMPVMDGIALVRALRGDPATAEIPVMLLSARAGEEARIEGLDAGSDDYLEKPFSAHELMARVAARIEIARLRRDAAREIAKREGQLRAVTQHAPVMLLHIDREGRYLFANDVAAARYGRRPEDLPGRKLSEVLPEETYRRIEPYVLEALQGRCVEFDERLDYPVAGARWVHGSYVPQRDARGDPDGFVAVVQDITDRKNAELKVQQEAKRFEKLNEVGLSLAGESDLERIVQAVTDAATSLSGAEFGAFFYNVVKPDNESYMLYTISGVPRERFARFPMPRNTEVFGPTFRGEGIVRVDDITRDPRYGRNAPHAGMPKGHLPVCSYLAVPVFSRSGEVLGGLFFGHAEPGRFNEAAERTVAGIAAQAAVAIDNARLHEQRLRLIGELQEADRLKDEFIATLSHELRNPLAPLRSGLQVLELDAGSARKDLIPMMTRQVNQLVRLVDDLLEVARINRGTLALRKEKVELHAIVRHAVEASAPMLNDRGHELVLSLSGGKTWIDADPARISQVLSNLLSNAARYTDPHGRIEVRSWIDGGWAHVSVTDTGMGFEPGEGSRLFEMFVRGQRSQGLGIGLALARRLAEMHGGTLSGASAGAGRGATFTLSLPAAPPAEVAPGSSTQVPSESLPPIRVLVVDDNRDAADTLQMLLDMLGASTRVAHEGASALSMFELEKPDAVLLDIGMPGMDGYEVARKLRARHPDWRGTLIALTGWGQENDRRKGREAGFDHHLVKPVALDSLQNLLSSLRPSGSQ